VEKMEPHVELMGELRERGESPGPMVQALRRAHSGGPGGVGCSVGRKKGGGLWMTQTPRDIITVTRTSPQKRDKP
jgi:hypothetical protein